MNSGDGEGGTARVTARGAAALGAATKAPAEPRVRHLETATHHVVMTSLSPEAQSWRRRTEKCLSHPSGAMEMLCSHRRRGSHAFPPRIKHQGVCCVEMLAGRQRFCSNGGCHVTRGHATAQVSAVQGHRCLALNLADRGSRPAQQNPALSPANV